LETKTDEELVALSQQGDVQAFNRLTSRVESGCIDSPCGRWGTHRTRGHLPGGAFYAPIATFRPCATDESSGPGCITSRSTCAGTCSGPRVTGPRSSRSRTSPDRTAAAPAPHRRSGCAPRAGEAVGDFAATGEGDGETSRGAANRDSASRNDGFASEEIAEITGVPAADRANPDLLRIEVAPAHTAGDLIVSKKPTTVRIPARIPGARIPVSRSWSPSL